MNLTLDEPARLVWIGQVDHRSIVDILHRGPRDARDRDMASAFNADVGKHAQSKLRAGIRDVDTRLGRSGGGTDLGIDVAHPPRQDNVRIRFRRHARRRANADTRKVLLVDIGDDPHRRQIDDCEHLRGGIHVHAGIGHALGDDAADWRRNRGDGADVLPRRETIDGGCRQAEQLEARSRAFESRELRGVLGVQPFELLTTGRANLHQLLSSLQFAFVGVELGAGRDIARLRLRQFRAEDLRYLLTAPHTLPEFDTYPRHAARDKRRDHDLFVRVGLDDSWQPEYRSASANRDRGKPDSSALNRLGCQCHRDVGQPTL